MEPLFFDNRLNIAKNNLVKTIREGDSVSVAAASFCKYAHKEPQEQLDFIGKFGLILAEPDASLFPTATKRSSANSLQYSRRSLARWIKEGK